MTLWQKRRNSPRGHFHSSIMPPGLDFAAKFQFIFTHLAV